MVPATLPTHPLPQQLASQLQPVPKKMKSRLFIGEGNFTYTEALLTKHKDIPELALAITATELEVKRPCDSCVTSFLHPEKSEKCDSCVQIDERIERLKQKGVKVLLGIDGTQISTHFKGKRFQRIHWNVPHDGSNFKAQTLPKLVLAFFLSCASVQIEADRVHVTLPQPIGQKDFRQGYQYNIVDGATLAGYQLIKKRAFIERYGEYGYEHVQTKKMESANCVDIHAREFVFQKISILQLLRWISTSNPNSATFAQELSSMGPKKYIVVSKEYYKDKTYGDTRSNFYCSTDDDSSSYSDSDSEEEKPQDIKADIAASITDPLQSLKLDSTHT